MNRMGRGFLSRIGAGVACAMLTVGLAHGSPASWVEHIESQTAVRPVAAELGLEGAMEMTPEEMSRVYREALAGAVDEYEVDLAAAVPGEDHLPRPVTLRYADREHIEVEARRAVLAIVRDVRAAALVELPDDADRRALDGQFAEVSSRARDVLQAEAIDGAVAARVRLRRKPPDGWSPSGKWAACVKRCRKRPAVAAWMGCVARRTLFRDTALCNDARRN